MPPAMHTDAVISVVIIHRDRPDAVGRTVEAFRHQTTPTSIIVVDNGSAPETEAASFARWWRRTHHDGFESGLWPRR